MGTNKNLQARRSDASSLTPRMPGIGLAVLLACGIVAWPASTLAAPAPKQPSAPDSAATTETTAASPTAALAASGADENLPLLVEGGSGLTLAQAMDAAAAHAYAVKIAHATTGEAENRASQTRGSLGPKLSLEATDTIIRREENDLVGQSLPNGTRVPSHVETAALVATQPLIGLAPLLIKLKAEALQAEAARAEEQGSVSDARLNGADSYVRALKAFRLYQIAKTSQAAITQQRNDAAAMERQGKLSSVDVMRLDLALSEAKIQLILARSTMDVAAVGLAETLGLPEQGPAVVLQDDVAKSASAAVAPAAPVTQMIAQAASIRPDVAAADKRAEAAKQYSRASKYDFLPSLNSFARYERDFQATDVAYPATAPGGARVVGAEDARDKLSFGLALNWTLWDWRQRARRVEEYANTATKAQLVHAALVSKVRVEVAQAHAEARYAQEALSVARSSLQLAEEVYRATDLKFHNGLATSTDLVTAERDQSRARANLANAQGDILLALLKLRRAGGETVVL